MAERLSPLKKRSVWHRIFWMISHAAVWGICIPEFVKLTGGTLMSIPTFNDMPDRIMTAFLIIGLVEGIVESLLLIKVLKLWYLWWLASTAGALIGARIALSVNTNMLVAIVIVFTCMTLLQWLVLSMMTSRAILWPLMRLAAAAVFFVVMVLPFFFGWYIFGITLGLICSLITSFGMDLSLRKSAQPEAPQPARISLGSWQGIVLSCALLVGVLSGLVTYLSYQILTLSPAALARITASLPGVAPAEEASKASLAGWDMISENQRHMFDRSPSWWNLFYFNDERDNYDTVSIFTTSSKLWTFSWCATTSEILRDNISSIEVRFLRQEMPVPAENIAEIDQRTAGAYTPFCHIYSVLINHWPEGEYQLINEINIKRTINNGNEEIKPGLRRLRYLVNAQDLHQAASSAELPTTSLSTIRQDGEVTRLVTSPKGSMLAVVVGDEVSLLRLPGLEKIGENIKGCDEARYRNVFDLMLIFSPDERYFWLSCPDDEIRTLRLWEVASQESITIPASYDSIWSMALSPDGRWLARSGREKGIYLLDTMDRQTVYTITIPVESEYFFMNGLAFSPDSQTLISVGDDLDRVTQVMFWDVDTRVPLESAPVIPPSKPQNRAEGGTRSIALSPDGGYLAVSFDTGKTIIWDLRTNPPAQAATLNILKPTFSFAGDLLAGVSSENDSNDTIQFWRISNWTAFLTEIHSPGEIFSMAFNPDSSLLYTGTDRMISIWEVPGKP